MSYEADAKITLSAEDNASGVIKSATDEINSSWKTYRNEQRAAERSTILSNTSLYETATVMRQVGHIAHQVTSIYTSYTVQELRLSDAHKRVLEAQEKLSEAYATGDLKKIKRATEELTDAQEANKRAIDESRLAMVNYGFQVAGIAGSVIREIPKIKSLYSTLTNGGASSLFTTGAGALLLTKGGPAAAAGIGMLTGEALRKPLTGSDKSLIEQATGADLSVPGIPNTFTGFLGAMGNWLTTGKFEVNITQNINASGDEAAAAAAYAAAMRSIQFNNSALEPAE